MANLNPNLACLIIPLSIIKVITYIIFIKIYYIPSCKIFKIIPPTYTHPIINIAMSSSPHLSSLPLPPIAILHLKDF